MQGPDLNVPAAAVAMRKVLFVCWDAHHVTYLEGLFLPIFEQLAQKGFEFHVIQFSWADRGTIAHITNVCQEKSVHYVHVPITLKPVAVIGKFLTLARGSSIIRRYIVRHKIDVVIPRSTMPAKMVLSIMRNIPGCKVIFDADGLPIEERVELTGLKVGSLRYRALKRIERQMMQRSERVLTRTKKAVSILAQQHSIDNVGKFFVVKNGRDGSFFKRSTPEEIASCKASLGIPRDAFVLVYCGSLGPQYGIKEMRFIHQRLLEWNPNTYLLLIVTNPDYASRAGLLTDRNSIVKCVPFSDVPMYLSVGDVAFAIREPLYSMQGVAPIKLGEYLLTGLPLVASSGIGDTREVLVGKEFAFLLMNHSTEQLEMATKWIEDLPPGEILRKAARQAGEQDFDLAQCVTSYEMALKNM